MNTNLDPQIYVACLASYNAGCLHGCWIDATQEVEEIHKEIKAMLSASPFSSVRICEAWAIHDYENFDGLEISEYEGLETVSEKALFVQKYDGELAQALIDEGYCTDLKEAGEMIEYRYEGVCYKLSEFAEKHFLEYHSHGLPHDFEWLICYINFERYARDIFIDKYFYIEIQREFSRGLHVFQSY